MTWGGVAMGVGSAIGGIAGSGALGGGQSNTMPSWMRWANRNNVERAQQIASTPQQYYPGQTYVGALPSEQNAFGMQSNYNSQMFGQPSYGNQGFDPLQAGNTGQNGYQAGSSPFGNTLGAMNSQLTGNTAQGQMAGAVAPFAMGQLGQSFQGPSQINPYQYTPSFGQAGGLDARGTIGSMLGGQQGIYGNLAGQANAQMGQFGQAGNLDATNAYQKMLSGQGDYGTLQANIEAANAPILRQLNQEIIPGLNSRATFLNNGTGGIKTLNKVLPDIAERMSQNATGLYEGERQRALGAQQQAAGQVGQAGLQQGSQMSSQMYGAGMQGMQDRSNAANLVSSGGLSAYGLGLQGSGLNANQQNQYRSDVLGLGNLGAGLAGDSAMSQARMAALFPSLAQAGRQPASDAAGYAQFQRGLSEQALGADVNRWNYNQQEPMNRASWLTGILGQTSTGQPIQQPNSATGAIGGMIAGGQLGQIFGNSFGLGQSQNQSQMPSSIQGAYNPQFAAPVYNGVMPSLWGG
jgi:hypothetical protein